MGKDIQTFHSERASASFSIVPFMMQIDKQRVKALLCRPSHPHSMTFKSEDLSFSSNFNTKKEP